MLLKLYKTMGYMVSFFRAVLRLDCDGDIAPLVASRKSLQALSLGRNFLRVLRMTRHGRNQISPPPFISTSVMFNLSNTGSPGLSNTALTQPLNHQEATRSCKITSAPKEASWRATR